MEQLTLEKVNENVEMLKQRVFEIENVLENEIEILEETELSEGDRKALEESRVDEEEGNLTSLEDLKAELNL